MSNWFLIHDLHPIWLPLWITDRSATSSCWTKELVQSKHVKHTPHSHARWHRPIFSSKPPGSQLQHLCQSAHSSESHPLQHIQDPQPALHKEAGAILIFHCVGGKRATIWNFLTDCESWNSCQPYLKNSASRDTTMFYSIHSPIHTIRNIHWIFLSIFGKAIFPPFHWSHRLGYGARCWKTKLQESRDICFEFGQLRVSAFCQPQPASQLAKASYSPCCFWGKLPSKELPTSSLKTLDRL